MTAMVFRQTQVLTSTDAHDARIHFGSAHDRGFVFDLGDRFQKPDPDSQRPPPQTRCGALVVLMSLMDDFVSSAGPRGGIYALTL